MVHFCNFFGGTHLDFMSKRPSIGTCYVFILCTFLEPKVCLNWLSMSDYINRSFLVALLSGWGKSSLLFVSLMPYFLSCMELLLALDNLTGDTVMLAFSIARRFDFDTMFVMCKLV